VTVADVGRRFTQSRHLNSSRDDASDRKTSSRCPRQEGGREGGRAVGVGVDARIYVGAQKERERAQCR